MKAIINPQIPTYTTTTEMIDNQLVVQESKLEASRVTWKRIMHIADTVASYYGFTFDQFRVKGRHFELAQARKIAMGLSYRDSHASYQTVGSIFGGRHHGTIIHADKWLLFEYDQKGRVFRDVNMIREILHADRLLEKEVKTKLTTTNTK